MKNIEPLSGFSISEIETRLQSIFNGYLGSDTGDTPEELQTNHYLIMLITSHFKEISAKDVDSQE